MRRDEAPPPELASTLQTTSREGLHRLPVWVLLAESWGLTERIRCVFLIGRPDATKPLNAGLGEAGRNKKTRSGKLSQFGTKFYL